MKALTIREPYASLIAIGEKHIETRGWQAPPDVIGQRIAIHVAKGFTTRDFEFALMNPHAFNALENAGIHWITSQRRHCSGSFTRTRGRIIATAEFIDCVRFGGIDHFWAKGECWSLTERELAFGDFAPGRYGFLLRNVIQLPEFVPATGQLGFWEWDPGELAE